MTKSKSKPLILASSKTIDATIAKYIILNPVNLDLAFELAAVATGITKKVAQHRYYRHIRYGRTLFYTGSKKLAYPNTKNVCRGRTAPIAPVRRNIITLW